MDLSEITPLLPAPVRAESQQDGSVDAARDAADADFESFLTLLTAQLQNQDPLQPIDSTEFIAQLASFSSVEQQIGTNERLDTLSKQALTTEIASFASWIGREVAATDGSFRATGEPVSFPVPEVEGAERVEAIVRDAGGLALHSFTVVSDETGQAQWDGLDASGNLLSGRELSIELTYFEGGSALLERPAEVLRLVSGIRSSEDGLVLDLEDGGTLASDLVSRLEVAPTESN